MANLNPRVDFAFKKLFGSEGHQEILIAFINAVIEPETRIKQVRLLNPENYKDYAGDKASILDIKAVDEQGRHYNIEMQVTDQTYYHQRILYYWSKLYSSQLRAGYDFDRLNKTISINILNFNYFNEETDYHNVFRVLNVRSHKSYFEDLELHFIELKKFNKDLRHLITALDRWTTFLQKADRYSRKDLPAELKQEPAIDKAMEALETLYLDDMEREIYEARLKWLRDESATLKKAEAKGRAQGLVEGEAKGRAEGEAKGRVEGKAEGQTETIRQIALKMIRQGLALDTISMLTGLTVADIQALQQKTEI